MAKLLEIEDLRVEFRTHAGLVKAVDGISYGVEQGETVALVGESGCGKSMSALAVMGLVPSPGRTGGGSEFDERRAKSSGGCERPPARVDGGRG